MGSYGYESLIEERGGVTIVANETDDDYQGDSILLVEKNGEYGLLTFGWGSCSGCDAYEAAYGNESELNELGDELVGSIEWVGSLTAAKDRVASKDWDGTWLQKDTIQRFKAAVAEL